MVQLAETDSVTDATDTPDSSVSMPDRSPTLYDLFSRTAERTPDALALCDPPNKRRITGEDPVELTYAQAEVAVASLSSQFIRAGLPAGSIVAVQLPNTVEFPLTLLAAWRAGLVVALLPQLWRQAELAEALNRVGARAIITSGRIELIDHADLAMNAAAEAFSIRHVMGFGETLPDGMTPLDWRQRESFAPNLSINARKAAIASFDITRSGMIAVPRSHVNLIAGGLAIYMESALPSAAQIVSTALLSSFAGLTSSIVLWLLSGGSLRLHHPFDPQVLADQIRAGNCDTLIAPAELALRMSESSAIDAQPSLRHVIGLWRTPERVAASPDWKAKSAALTDVYLFAEMGLFALNRQNDGAAAPVTLTHHDAARAGELLLTPKGTLGLRGPMVTLAAYRPLPKADASLMTAEPSVDYVDTGYPAKREGQNGQITLTGTPAGIANVGGYRFREDDLEQWARRLAPGTVMMALPDPMNGFRLAGRSSENARARGALAELGLNPLMTEAFRQRERQA